MRKVMITAAAVASAAVLALSGCSGASDRGGDAGGGDAASGFEEGSVIGVALPDKTSENWTIAGEIFTDALTEAGYEPNVQYAGSTSPVPDQQAQISTMIQDGAKVIVIGANDAKQLGSQVADAKEQGVTIISYDRLISDTENVDYYVAFNNFKVGQEQGQALLDGLAAKFPDKTTYNIELIAGAATDPNAAVFFNGAMDVLQPKIDDGTLVVVSGQDTFEQVQTDKWDPANAQSRMDTVLQGFYQGDVAIDGVLAPNDTLARAAIQSVKDASKGPIVVTGQDSEAASIPLIMSGEQYMTIYKDTRKLVAQTVEMIKSLAAGEEAETNAEEDNGAKEVPTFYLDPVVVTAENAAEVYKDNDTLFPLTQQ
ncbi:sugar-binding protein [Naasia sp. SYSU D00057]|uniref:substrate-binding domain-containing protein n=1 Tax=Naasia sp. SYSU D00057 TaxID=2817380 RepID=UPI001B301AA1|nr:sugar-binding protein [Naasia sp. SYSU D00057]